MRPRPRACRCTSPTKPFAELRCQFDERQIVELTFAVAIESFYNRINAPLEVEAEGFCAISVPHPAPAARGSVWANRPS